MASRTVRKVKQSRKKNKAPCEEYPKPSLAAPCIVISPPPASERIIPAANNANSSSFSSAEGVHSITCFSTPTLLQSDLSNYPLDRSKQHRLAEETRETFFFENGIGVRCARNFDTPVSAALPPYDAAVANRASGNVASCSPYKPVPPPRPVGGARRMPPSPALNSSPQLALPGSLPHQPLHTHSAKFPIEREVILSTCDKDSKIPILNEYRKRQERGVAVAPDAPRRNHAAWTVDMQMQATPGTSRGCPESGGYVARGDRDDTTVSIAVEGAKDAAREAKGASKAVAKTYHTLKDMISGRFRSGGASGEPKVDETAGLNNVSEEARKSTRERAERDADDAATRRRDVVNAASLQPPAVTARAQFPPQYFRPPSQGGDRIASPLHHQQQQQAPPLPQFTQRQMPITMNRQQMMDQAQCRGPPVPVAVSTPQHGHAQALYEAAYNTPSRTPIQQPNDAIYYRPQYGVAGNMPSGVPTDFRADMLHHTSGFPNPQQPSMSLAERIDNDRSVDVRSPQQLEREILRQRGLADSRRTASQPQLPQEQEQNQSRLDQIGSSTPANKMNGTPMRRGSHGNLIETLSRTQISSPIGDHEKDSDDGGFRSRLMAQGRSFDNKDRVHGNSGMLGQHSDRNFENVMKLNKCDINDDKSDPINGGMTSRPVFNSIPQAALRQTDLNDDGGNTSNMISKKINPGSAASSDYDKNGGPSSNVDSGRGSAAYSSGRHIGHDTSTESDPLPNRTITAAADHPGSSNKMYHEKNGNGGDSEWVDIVESELRQILDPKMQNGNPSTQLGGLAGSETASSVTPPLPPLSPPASTPDATPRNSARFKHQSLPYGSKPEYTDGRVVLPNQRAGWQHTPKHRSNTSKKQEQYVQYKKQMFGLDTTDITSTTTRSLDLSSMLDGQSDSDVSTQDARAIRRQLQGLEKMYCEVLKLLGVRKPTNHSLGKYQPTDPRMAKRRYGSVSSLPSSSVSSRPVRDKRRNATDQRKKVNDMQGINKRFQRLESHVVTLARSVAHLSSEMRTQHLMIQEMENIRGEITALRNQQRSQSMPRMDNSFCAANNTYGGMDASSLANPTRVKKLTKFFGDEPPLLRMFLKKLGYEKYAPLLENERVGAAELPFLGEERLRALGVPLGPRLRILHEARLALPPANSSHTTLCIV